ncbi:MAG: LysM peptidoglycan-binding domain-containing protein [Anaerolineales bacterium]|nr:LysM peptidoglycan-binding domain-containing protein [Anaerolineales bacterium]
MAIARSLEITKPWRTTVGRWAGAPAAQSEVAPAGDQTAEAPPAPANSQPLPCALGAPQSELALGRYQIQFGRPEGALITAIRAGAAPAVRARAKSPAHEPAPLPEVLDRQAELRQLSALLQAGGPIELHGPSGFGKTTLLRRLGERAPSRLYPDGAVQLSARALPADDVLQRLFAAFYETDPGRMPTAEQIRAALLGKQALVLLDDTALDGEAVAALAEIAPGCTFLLASTERRVWGEDRALALLGLPVAVAVELLERELGRELDAGERSTAQTLCYYLQGNPLRIRQAAALLREPGCSLGALQAAARSPEPGIALVRLALEHLTEAEQSILTTLAAARGAWLPLKRLAAAAASADPTPALEALQRRGLVVVDQARGALPGEAAQAIASQKWDLDRAAESLCDDLMDAAEGQGWAAAEWAEQIDLVIAMLTWASAADDWPRVWRLSRAVEGALARAHCWGTWGRVLQWALQAARRLDLPGGEAWALHQIGTRALCLGQTPAAHEALSRALRLRREQDDRPGTAITRQNLKLVLAPAAPRAPHGGPGAAPAALARPLLIAALAAAGILGLGFLGFSGWRLFQAQLVAAPLQAAALVPSATPTATSEGAPAASPTSEPALAATNTPAATSTHTPTRTPDPTATTAPSRTPLLSATATTTEAPAATLTHPPAATAANLASEAALQPSAQAPCQVRLDWPLYRVQAGNTLWSVAGAVGASVADLMQANCLASGTIYAGQMLRVPRLPATAAPPTPTNPPPPMPTSAPSETAAPTGAPTDTPSSTPEPSATYVPSETATELPTVAPLPSDTPLPSETPVPSETATSAPTATPPPSETPTEASTEPPPPSTTP